MSPGFVLYDDALARAAEPYSLTRPFGELRAGALLIRERWERLLGFRAAAFIGAPHLAAFDEFDAPQSARGVMRAGTVIANSRFAPALDGRVMGLKPGQALVADSAVVAIALRRDTPVERLSDGSVSLDSLDSDGPSKVVIGWWMEHTWDLIRHLQEMLAADAASIASNLATVASPQVSVLGAHRFAAARGTYIEPRVVVDTSAGDIVVLEGARIGAFTRLAGPAVIGAHTLVAGGRYSCIATGEHSRVCGEMSVVSVSGYANKAHDGFVGHSIIGRWANLGAGTITSNLKNSYGPVRVKDSRGEHETGMQFLGSLIGDHAKTAIGTRLNTGTIVGAGANVFGDRSPSKYVPPFAWGDLEPFTRYELSKFLEVARHVMLRREIALSPGTEQALSAAWELSQPRPARRQTPTGNGADARKTRRNTPTSSRRRQ